MVACIIAMSNWCLAQKIVSLRAFEIKKNATDSSESWSKLALYVKDMDNELNQFVGAWKGSAQGRTYEFSFVKKTNYKPYAYLNKSTDLLIGWITVKDTNGNVVYTNTAKEEADNGFKGENFQVNTNMYRFFFYAKCKYDSGLAFIKIDAATRQMKLYFAAIDDIMQKNECPDGYVPLLPVAPNILSLTRQSSID